MRRHRFDPYAFVFGLTFAASGGLLLNTDLDVADLAGAGWLPLPALVAGLFLLAVGLDRAWPQREETPVPSGTGELPAEEPPAP